MFKRALRPFALMAMMLAVALGLTACGGKSNDNAAPSTSVTPVSCPTDNTKAFPKGRFVGNLSIAAGAVKFGIYNPYKAGKFKSGAKGRILAIGAAGASGLLAANRLKAAKSDVLADPTLCKALGNQITQASAAVDQIKEKIKSGDFASITSLSAIMGTIISQGKEQGLNIEETKPNIPGL